MINARFRIELPTDLWVAELSNQYPRATFRLLSGCQLDDHAIELGEVITDYPAAVADAVASHPSIENYEKLESVDRRVLGRYETSDTQLYEFASSMSVTIEFPVAVQNGWYEFDLTGTREEFERLEKALGSLPLSYKLESIIGSRDPATLLTDRQREILELAVREGYFEVPRECTLADLAEKLNVDKSTVSTVIRRGEQQVIEWFLTAPAQLPPE